MERGISTSMWQKNSLYAILLISVAAGGYGILSTAWQSGCCEFLAQTTISHGEKQVQKMLVDRPNMAKYTALNGEIKAITPQDAIWQWAAKNYNTTIYESRINWDKGELIDKPSHYIAENTSPQHGQSGSIRIRPAIMNADGKLEVLSFEMLWNACIFELINIRNAEKSLAIYSQALTGEINRAQFVRQYQLAEYQSLVKLKQFYQDVWLPWATAHKFASNPELWEQSLPASYEEWIRIRYGQNNAYKYFEDYYDRVIVPHLKHSSVGQEPQKAK
ncbi:MAG: hypothetical protein CVV27_04085 [Candidatus Melainabacteria bacterium HGW-Melainabacteria-1]|nr:MAG: hypothetical protein CVV27_04085 [Candidatus Melainabacteria bacterium HGW-Melainabacteria-1]